MDPSTAARIHALKDVSGWEDLTASLNEIVNKRWDRIRADMVTGKPIDQREIDFTRGITHGIRVLLNAPDKAATIFERHNQEVPVAK